MCKALVLSVAGLLLLRGQSTARPEKNEAEELFRRTEEKFLTAKSIKTEVEIAVYSCPGGYLINGSAAYAEGGRSCLEMKNSDQGSHTIYITDGKQAVRIEKALPVERRDVPDGYAQALRTGFMRSGLGLTSFVALAEERKPFRADEHFKMTDFKFGAEGIPFPGPAGSRAIQYTLVVKGLRHPKGDADARLRVCLWVDATTNLPVQRVIMGTERSLFLTEKYTALTLDGKIDPKQFEIPKE